MASKGGDSMIGQAAPVTGTAADGGLFNGPQDVAVDQDTGQVFVADRGLHRIQRLATDGTFEAAWGRNVSESETTGDDSGAGGFGFEVCTIAADCQGGSSSNALGGFAGDRGGMFDDPEGVAVDQDTGHLFVTDAGNQRIQEFSFDDNGTPADPSDDLPVFERAVGWDVTTGGATELEACTVATDCKAGVGGSGAGQLGNGSPARLDLSKDGSPATGKVFVADPVNRRVMELAIDGSFTRAWGIGVDSGSSTAFEICTTASTCQAGSGAVDQFYGTNVNQQNGGFSAGRPDQVAVGEDGVVYAPTGIGGDNVRIMRFDSTAGGDDDAAAAAMLLADPIGSRASLGHPLIPGIPSGLEVDPETGRLLYLVDPLDGDTVVTEVDLAGVPARADIHMRGSGAQPVNGLGVDRSGSSDRLLVSASDGFIGHRLLVLDEDGAAPAPAVTLAPPSDVGAHSAVLGGTVNPNGSPFSTKFHYEYSANGVTWTPLQADIDLGNGTSPVDLPAQTLEGLDANSFYRVRIVASRALGAGTTVSAELSFLTDRAAPGVETLAATRIADTTAQLQGRLNPEGLPTDWHFEHVEDTELDLNGWANATRTPVPDAVATGNGNRTVTAELDGLEPSTTYHFRLVASNGEELDPVGSLGETVVVGATQTFSTRPAVSAPAGRAYEMVTSPEKVNRRGEDCDSNFLLMPGACPATAFVSPDGERILWSAGQGTIVDPESGNLSSGQRNWEVISRKPGGWDAEAIFNQPYIEASTDPVTVMDGLSSDLLSQAWRVESGMFPSLGSHGTRLVGDGGGLNGSGWYDWTPQSYINPGYKTGSDTAVMGNDRRFMVRFDGKSKGAYRGLLGTSDPSRPGYPDEAQEIRIVAATGGTFRLTFDGRTTGPLPWDASASQLQAGLVGLSNVEPGEVRVTADVAQTWIVTFRGAKARLDLPQLTVDSTTLAGASKLVTVETLGDGIPSAPAVVREQLTGAAPYLSGAPDWLAHDLLSECTAGTELPARIDSGSPWPSVADDATGTVPCGPGEVMSTRGALPGGQHGVADNYASALNANAVSEDGRRIVLVSPDPRTRSLGGDALSPGGCVDQTAAAGPGVYGRDSDCRPQVFVRQYGSDGEAALRWISRSEVAGQNADGLFDGAIFENASTDGRHVFFKTRAPLTADDPNGGCGAPCTTGTASDDSWDLYRYTLPESLDDDPTGSQAGGLERITGGPNGDDDPNTNAALQLVNQSGGAVQQPGGGGALRHVSDDGSKVYFVTRAPLDAGGDAEIATDDDPWNVPPTGVTQPPGGSVSQNSTRNLYLYDGDADSYRFVARIPFGDLPAATLTVDQAACASSSTIPAWPRSIEGAIIDRSCVRGTSSGDAILFESGARLTGDDADDATDIYLYDADERELVRVSAPPAGTSPYMCNLVYPGGSDSPELDPDRRCNADLGPPPTEFGQNVGGTSGLRNLNLSEDPAGSFRAVYFESRVPLVAADVNGDHMDTYEWRGGKLSLISPGNSPDHAFYSGNSRDGEDVFIHTTQRISPWEIDASDGDVYDVRLGGGFPDPPPPAEVCDAVGDGCQGALPESPSGPRIESDGSGGGNAESRDRVRLSVTALGAKARRAVARSGVIRLKVSTTAAGRIAAVAKGRLRMAGRRVRSLTLARAQVRVSGPGTRVVRLRLSPPALRVLRAGRAVPVVVRLTQGGARSRTLNFVLRRTGR